MLIPRSERLWIFGAWFGDKYSDNTKALFEYIHYHQKDFTVIWLTKNQEIKVRLNNEGKKCELIWSLKGVLLSLKAGYVVYSSGVRDINPYFINGAKIFNTWHGAPMKKIGYDDKYNNNSINTRIIPALYPFLKDNLSGIVSTSDAFNSILCSAFKVSPEIILCSGYPRNDILYSLDLHPLVSDWNSRFHNPVKVLYLPTFRSHSDEFKPFLQYNFDENNWDKFLIEHNIILISKGHFIDKEVGFSSESPRIIHLSDNNIDDVNWLLKDADILITDYSGAYFDFLLTGKPIIFAHFDYEDYVSKNRELYFNLEEIICGPVVRNWVEVQSSILNLLDGDEYKMIRNEKCLVYNKYQDSRSSERLFQMIIN